MLAWRDWLHEWRISLCLVLGLAAVLAPLLVLFGLKSGIVTTMTERLRSDPHTREVVLRGHYRLDAAWFERIATNPAVAFLIPDTRELSATMNLAAGPGTSLLDVDMIPTGRGDPLLGTDLRPPDGFDAALLTSTAARALGVGVGDRISATIDRTFEGKPQAATLTLIVSGVVPEAAFGRNAVFVSLPLLTAAEDYRDGLRVAAFDAAGEEPSEGRSFSSFRLYARSLDDVAPLADRLRDERLEVVTRAKDIESVKAIDRVLTFVFLVLASIGVVGYLLSLASSLWANVDRKRREIAILRLIGFGVGPVAGFPAVQALLVAVAGTALSATLYGGVAALFNAVFRAELGRDEFVCRLSLADGLTAAGLTMVCAVIASLGGGYRAARIEPAESLRTS